MGNDGEDWKCLNVLLGPAKDGVGGMARRDCLEDEGTRLGVMMVRLSLLRRLKGLLGVAGDWEEGKFGVCDCRLPVSGCRASGAAVEVLTAKFFKFLPLRPGVAGRLMSKKAVGGLLFSSDTKPGELYVDEGDSGEVAGDGSVVAEETESKVDEMVVVGEGSLADWLSRLKKGMG